MSDHTIETLHQLRALDEQMRALPAGETRDALRATFEALIASMAREGYTLRRGHELPPL